MQKRWLFLAALLGFLFLVGGAVYVNMRNHQLGLVPPSNVIPITPKIAPSTNHLEKSERFVIKSHGTFNAGYEGAEREIFIMEDTVTGDEYIGITDCTLIKNVKNRKKDTDSTVFPLIQTLL